MLKNVYFYFFGYFFWLTHIDFDTLNVQICKNETVTYYGKIDCNL